MHHFVHYCTLGFVNWSIFFTSCFCRLYLGTQPVTLPPLFDLQGAGDHRGWTGPHSEASPLTAQHAPVTKVFCVKQREKKSSLLVLINQENSQLLQELPSWMQSAAMFVEYSEKFKFCLFNHQIIKYHAFLRPVVFALNAAFLWRTEAGFLNVTWGWRVEWS